MRKLSIAIMVVLGSAALADIDHSQLVNMPGAGTGAIAGGDLSMLEAGENTFGFGAQSAGPNTMADDFTVGGGGFMVTSITMYIYVTGATAPTVTNVNYAIASAPVIGSGLTA